MCSIGIFQYPFSILFFSFQISDDVLIEVNNLREGKATGYIHNVSPLKNNHFDFQLQTKNKTIRAVCFDKSKKNHLEAFCKSKSPVKIKKFRLETKSNSEDLLMDKTVSIEEYSEIDFDRKDIPANLTISMLKSICIGQLVTVKAKLVSLGAVREVNNGRLKLIGCLIDPTDSIKITIWQEYISQVQQEYTYMFKNIRLKKNSVTSEIYVNTAKSDETTITGTDEFKEQLAIPLNIQDYINTTSTGEIICVDKVTMYHSCCKCHKKVQLSNTTITVDCNNCKTKQKQKACKKEWVVHVTFECDNKNVQITLFDNVIQSIIKQLRLPQTTQELTEKQMTDIIFSLPEVLTTTFNKKTKAASNIII